MAILLRMWAPCFLGQIGHPEWRTLPELRPALFMNALRHGQGMKHKNGHYGQADQIEDTIHE